MVRTFTKCLLLAMVLVVAANAYSRLPEEALREAQQAEKYLKANKPQEAILLFDKLDKKYPNEPAIKLRLAQIYDTLNSLGPALFYYRKYAEITGEKANEEAKMRLYVLELSVNVPKEAEEFAKKLGTTSGKAMVPTPEVQLEKVALNPDGTTSSLSVTKETPGPVPKDEMTVTEEEPARKVAGTNQIEKKTRFQAASTPALGESTVSNRKEETRQPSAPPAETRPMVTPVPTVRRLTPTPPPEVMDNMPSTKPETSADSPASASSQFTPPPFAKDDDPAEAKVTISDESGAEPTAKGPRPVISLDKLRVKPVTPEPTPAPSATIAAKDGDESDQAPASSKIQISVRPAPKEPTAPAPSDPAEFAQIAGKQSLPAAASPTSSPQPKGTPANQPAVFKVQESGDGKVTIAISNGNPESILTFGALPEGKGRPLNAILNPREAKEFKDVEPGTYEILLNITSTDYPPRPLVDKKFNYEFVAGHRYRSTLMVSMFSLIQ
ncbi:MAG: hypothetical protein K1X53_12790 [Candidatus Sumerlaeaceae bacterium]|nr:hypothetical protein [Candidatus Sumerlaeaceae bacterium]